ncbi:MAG TPA: type IX secretion system sortase PorU, partial [Bacteroidota bacterium]|nr:type IX secretion system sortase PorU [Bacteroidota bacterium]
SNASAIPAQIANFPDEQSQLTFSFESNSPTGLGFIDSYEIAYQHFFRAQGDLLTFHTADTNATARYVSTGFTGGQITAYDVTRFDSVTTIGNATLASDTCSFNLTLQAGSPHEIYVVGQNGYQIAGSLTHIPNQDIHGDTTTAVNIIIAYPDFLPAAQRLKAFHDAPGPEYAPTLVLDVNQVYNEFGGGLPSTGAIRNCLRYLFARGAGDTLTTPRYALFLGDGDYDPKRVIGTGPEWIPAWETVDSFDPLLSYATEDSFAIFDGSGRMSLGVGRLPAQSLDDANTMVDKIIEYARSPIIDPWKVRTTFVADDGPADPGVNDGFIHTDDAEGISQLVPLLFNEVKIYEYAYPTVITSEGRKKPLVNQAIDNQINDGTLILNFNGHGNPRLWTHEGVFVRETDFPLLHNKGKYFFLVAATCNYSYFDEVGDQSGGELLVLMKNAGAIAVVSATRAVYEGLNYELNAALYSNNLFQTSGSSLVRQTFGDVMYRTKQIRTDDNDRKYLLIGDPALHIAFPTMYASVDSVSHISAVGPVQLKALSSANVYATVTNAPGISGASIDGNAIVEVYDADKSVQISDVLQYGSQSVPITDSFSIAGDVLFRGQETAANGIISANFVVPKDISYTNNPGKVTIYFSNSALDGAGYTRNVLIGGTDSSAAKDTQGPTVQLYLNSRTFHSGDIVGTNPVLIADLQDEHGINTSGAGVGHRLEAWLDNATESTDLSNYYQSKAGDYRQGTIQYPYSGLTEGTHKLRLRAWDTYDNPTTGETVFSVVSSSGLQLSNVFNYPNPFSHGTIFTFTHNELGSLNVEVKVYTVAGRLIRTLEATSGSAHGNTVQVPWDGRDRDGSAIANGTYLYKIIAHTTDSRFNAEALGKLTVLK